MINSTTALKYICGFCCLFLIIAITIGALVPVFIGKFINYKQNFSF